MLNDFNERLATGRANVRQREKLDAKLRAAKKMLVEAENTRDNFKKVLFKEESDVGELVGVSITGVFFSLLGSKESRLDKERQEVVAAKLNLDHSTVTVEDLNRDMRQIADELSQFENADAEFERLLGEKEKYLIDNDSGVARQMVELTQQIADLTADRKELNEAVAAGQSALAAVRRIQASLASASNWGTLDMMGGGMMTTMVKHSKIDRAKNQARIAQRELLRFEAELADADVRLQTSLQIDGFSKFADYFFDGLIADWVMQSKIAKAKDECSRTVARVRSGVNGCRVRLRSVDFEIAALAENMRELIETT